jgi:Fe-S cluster assembly iron-binding protein IscA
MIHITERAKQELIKILSKKVDWPGARLRLMSRSQGKLGLGVDIEAPGDHIVEYKGVKVLVVAPELAKSLQGVTLDVDDTPEGAELVISEKSDKPHS